MNGYFIVKLWSASTVSQTQISNRTAKGKNKKRHGERQNKKGTAKISQNSNRTAKGKIQAAWWKAKYKIQMAQRNAKYKRHGAEYMKRQSYWQPCRCDDCDGRRPCRWNGNAIVTALPLRWKCHSDGLAAEPASGLAAVTAVTAGGLTSETALPLTAVSTNGTAKGKIHKI